MDGAGGSGAISLLALGNSYSQNFDSLATTGTANNLNINGWFLNEVGTSALSNGLYGAGTGSGTSGDVYSFGAAGNTERAFGTLFSGTLSPIIGAQFTNTTGGTVTSLDVSYTGEMWRAGVTNRNAADRLDFQFSTNATSLTTGTWVDVNALDFNSPNINTTAGALNGNATGNRTAVSSSIAALSISSGSSFWVRWTDFDISPGADDGLAIDDFSLTPQGSLAGNPTVNLSVSTNSASEAGTTVVTVTATASSAVASDQTVQLGVSGTGLTIDDYTLSNSLITIPSGFTSGAVTFTVVDDALVEGIETAVLSITNPSPGIELGATTSQNISIADNDFVISKIHDVQGSGATSPLVGQSVTVDAIVVGDFQNGDADNQRNLNGFYVQEENVDFDGDANTSEAIFVFAGSTNVAVGDRVLVTGNVLEFFGMTELSATSVIIVQAGAVANVNTMAIDVYLPAAGVTLNQNLAYQPDLENYEGMLVRFPETLTISEQFNLDRFNEIKLSAGGRPENYTNANDPSVAGYDAFLQDVGSRKITYDDGLNVQNASIDNLDGFAPYNTATAPRMGDTITDLTGVLDYQFAGNAASGSTWRVRSIANGSNTFTDTNPRPAAHDSVGGRLEVGSLNVLNYFRTLDTSSSATTAIGLQPRGANTAAEFDRQTAKLVNLLLAINPDMLGLTELENDFLPGSAGNALEYLVDQLNAQAGPGTYAWVNPGSQFLGGDAIAVGFIYQPAKIQIAAGTTIERLNDAEVAAFNPGLLAQSTIGRIFDGVNTSRNALAVSFTENATGEVFTAVINHFKSKSGTGTGADADQLDGQGNWQQQRELAAQALTEWVATDPTGSGDGDYVLLGDFNAYVKEDALDVVNAAGFHNLADERLADPYSYVFDAQYGALDHAFANNGLNAQVTGVTEWHINADEADALDYNLDFSRDPAIFDASALARESDHDPVLVGLSLESQQVQFAAGSLTVSHAEGDAGATAFTFTVERTGGTTGAVDFTIQLTSSSATGDDFVGVASLTQTIGGTIAAGDSSATFTVDVAGDDSIESDEDFAVMLTNVSNSAFIATTIAASQTAATGTIVNDDFAPVATDGALSTNEDTAAGSTLTATDLDSPSLTYHVVVDPVHGIVTITDAAAGTFTYQPSANYNGPDYFTFSASDGSHDSIATVSITVSPVNDKPTADAKSVTTGENMPVSLTLSGSDVETPAGSLVFAITVQPQHGTLAVNGSQVIYTPAIGYHGSDSFRYTVTDNGDGTSPALTSDPAIASITVTSANNQPVVFVGNDPLHPGQSALFVFGTSHDDEIEIESTCDGTFEVEIESRHVHFERTYSGPFSRIVVYGQAGDDHIEVDDRTATEAWLFGGAGDDHLQGGAGSNLLMGGTGDDHLQAGRGRDVLIGGDDSDHLQAGRGEDILIGGTTDYDANDAALAAILGEWNASASYLSRIANLQSLSFAYSLNNSTVDDDGDDDRLQGGQGLDWFFAHLTGKKNEKDKLDGRTTGEVVTGI
ncbi:MAG: ExeM/NucH family extracellular endonuclease [Pirellulaceae bacterium]